MKVCFINFLWDRLDGAVAVPQQLSKELARRGCEVSVITTHEDWRPAESLENGVRVYRFRPPNFYWVGRKESYPIALRAAWQMIDSWNPAAGECVRRRLHETRPDVVHVHKLRGLSPSVWSAARRSGSRVVVQTCHDYELISPEGTLGGRLGCWAIRGAWPIRPYQHLRAAASRGVNVVTAPSRFLLDTICDLGFFQDSQRKVIPNFHDVRLQDLTAGSPAIDRRPGPLRIAYLGRLEPNKGVNLLLDALSNVQDELELHIAGWGTLEGEVRARARTDHRIQFGGTVTGAAKHRLLSSIDALVVPSIWHETFGLVVVEAFARGTPVIASRMGALPSLIREGTTGWLFDPKNPDTLPAVLRRAARGWRELRAMRPACRESALRYTFEEVASSYLDLYAEALQQTHSRTANSK